MEKSELKIRIFVISLIALLFISISGLYLYQTVLQSVDEIIEANKRITNTATGKLALRFDEQLGSIWERHLKGKNRITKAEERMADSLLSAHVTEVLNFFDRVEGGLYFYHLDNFLGYGFPTIEPPKPAFGPPPRSYNIIRQQVRQTVHKDSMLVQVHEFDPAIFPLTTQPIYHKGEIIGAAWARVHIERELARYQTIQSGTFFLTVGVILFVLSVSVYFAIIIMKQLRDIKYGLEMMKQDPDYRLKEATGILGFISRSINEITEIQQREQQKSQRLERELFQKEKMASLGNLIAGTAHEINTPISIIKTRIQLWERKIKKHPKEVSSFTEKSLKMVRAEIERVSKLIKKLLYFSKPIGQTKEKTDLNRMIELQCERIKKVSSTSYLHFDLSLADDLPTVYVDSDSIEQVFTNILNNAVEASDENCNISIQTEYLKNQEKVKIKIKDNGCGLPVQEKHRLFDPFYTTKQNGSGLGLSISNEIINAHHGRIFFEHNGKDEISESTFVYSHLRETNEAVSNKTSGTTCVIILPVES